MKLKWFPILPASIAVVMLGGLVQSQAQSTQGDPVRGKQLAAECAACHGADGNSPSPVNPRLGGQHELYLFMALQAYVSGARSDSLMRGAVINKSEQDLRDIAAYFSQQRPSADGDSQGQTNRAGGRGGDTMRFDHGDRTAAFTSLVARAEGLAKSAQTVGQQACANVDLEALAGRDSDSDGVPDDYDAAPHDAAEFVADKNADGYFEICNTWQLRALSLSGESLARAYQLAQDLDLSELEDFEPIGNCGPTGNCMRALGAFGFAGIFDGQGHSIRNLTITRAEDGGVGLFGVLAESGVVMNVNLVNVSVTGRAGTGALVGSNFGVVFNSSADGRVQGALAIGGLVGGSGGLVHASRFRGTVAGQQAVGGLVGDMTGAVYYSVASAAVSGKRGVGGLVGLNTFGSVLGSAADGDVTGSNDIGGLVGVNTDAKVRNSFATGAVNGEGSNIGGLIGFNSLSFVLNSYARGRVVGFDGVGGLIGRNNGAVVNGYATGPVQGEGQTGGVVGIVVEGTQTGTFTAKDNPAPYGAQQVELRSMTATASGWIPVALPTTDLLNYFCDQNHNGFIDPQERTPDNYIWRFAAERQHPALSCAAEKN